MNAKIKNSIVKPLLGANLKALRHLVRDGAKGWAHASCCSFNATRFQPGDLLLREIPEVTLDVVLGPRRAEITIDVRRREDGMTPVHETLILCSVLRAFECRKIVEIGSFMGHTSLALAKALQESEIHTVDLPLDFNFESEKVLGSAKDDFHLIEARDVGREFRNTPFATRIHQHFQDTSKWDFSEVKNSDGFFIDGSHTYEHCLNDSEKCLSICKKPAVFFWHDCDASHPGVIQTLIDWRKLGRDIRRVRGTALAYWIAD